MKKFFLDVLDKDYKNFILHLPNLQWSMYRTFQHESKEQPYNYKSFVKKRSPISRRNIFKETFCINMKKVVSSSSNETFKYLIQKTLFTKKISLGYSKSSNSVIICSKNTSRYLKSHCLNLQSRCIEESVHTGIYHFSYYHQV